mmetsp:Transcript_29081/g.55876  ORF Transcript_29081/g.55876 Transcript_29081/m.55876 type:complete len:201 (+) Transcript_29081:159-761(+)
MHSQIKYNQEKSRALRSSFNSCATELSPVSRRASLAPISATLRSRRTQSVVATTIWNSCTFRSCSFRSSSFNLRKSLNPAISRSFKIAEAFSEQSFMSPSTFALIGKKSFKLREACNVSQAFAKLLKPDSLVDMTAPKRCIQWRCHSRSCVSCHVALRDMLRSRRMNTMYPKKIAKNEKTSSIGLRMAPRVPVRYVTVKY